MPDVLNLSLGCPSDALANLELLFPIPGTKTRKESMGEGERVSIVGLKKSRKLLTCLCVSQGRRKGQEQHENCSYLAHFSCAYCWMQINSSIPSPSLKRSSIGRLAVWK